MKYPLTYSQYRNGGIACLFLFGICIIVLILLFVSSWTSIWELYYTLAIEDTLELPIIHEVLQDMSISEVISAQSALVTFQNFSAMEYIPVQDIPKRAEEQDPRYTDYLKNIGGYFTTSDNDGRSYNIVYIMRNKPVILLYLQLWQLLGHYDVQWVLADIALVSRIWLLIAFVVLALLVQYLLYGKYTTFSILAVFPAALFTAVGSIATFVLAMLSYISFMRVLVIMRDKKMQDFKKKRMARSRSIAQCTVMSVLALIMLLINGKFSLLPIFTLVLLAWSLLVCFMYLKDKSNSLRHEHTVFRSTSIVPIEHMPIQVYVQEHIIFSLIVHLVLATLLFMPFLNIDTNGISVPRPKPAPSTTDWYEQIRTLWDNRSKDNLPDISEYLAHVALHDSLLFRKNYDYRLPETEEVIVIPNYTRDNGSIKQWQKVVFTFDKQWFQSKLEASLWPSVSNLLTSQAMYTAVSMEEEYSTQDFSERLILLIVASAFPLLISLGSNRKAVKYEDVFLIDV